MCSVAPNVTISTDQASLLNAVSKPNGDEYDNLFDNWKTYGSSRVGRYSSGPDGLRQPEWCVEVCYSKHTALWDPIRRKGIQG